MAKRILVLDDDRLVVKSLAKLLEKTGYEVSCAESSNEAQGLIEKQDYDLIISDIKMPGVDGIETVGSINSILKSKNKESIPVIFITGYFDESKHNEAEKLNPADFIYKPFDRDKFLNSISSALSRG